MKQPKRYIMLHETVALIFFIWAAVFAYQKMSGVAFVCIALASAVFMEGEEYESGTVSRAKAYIVNKWHQHVID